MSDSITDVLNALSSGQSAAQDQLLPLIYDELRVVARSRLNQVSRRGQTLNTTGLVHEAYLRLVAPDKAGEFSSRKHFYATAALAMRQLLVDRARRQMAEKRGSGAIALSLDDAESVLDVSDDRSLIDVIALDSALAELHAMDPGLAKLVELRFFLGLPVEEVSRLMEVPMRTLARDWQRARAFLQARLRD